MTNTAEWFRAWIPARHPRLDAPGTLQHVRGRGIEVTKIIREDTDREDFLSLARRAILEFAIREAFVLPVGNGDEGISERGGGVVSGGNDLGGNPCGPFGGTAWTPKVAVSSFRKNVPLYVHYRTWDRHVSVLWRAGGEFYIL